MIKLPNNIIELFDLEEAPEDERKEFIEDVADLIMKAVLRKAWADLDSDGRDTLTKLLEKSNSMPDDRKSSDAVFDFLDKNLPSMEDIIKNEINSIHSKFAETRDSLRDEIE